MKVSVVVCTYTMDRYPIFSKAIESILQQTYFPIELVIVIDGNEPVYERVTTEFGDIAEDGSVADITFHNNCTNRGISFSRTRGAELATGDIVAFIDDDGYAEPDWIETLVDTYQSTDAIAVGGYVAPNWTSEKPDFFPEEFYWLVGCTETRFAEHMEEVRNTYGCNISYKRAAFLQVGGYDPNTGRKGERHIQAHEPPVGIRLHEEFGRGVLYNENAVVHHTLFDYRGQFRWLIYRSFWQGYSKRIMNVLYDETYGNEGQYLRKVFLKSVPERILRLIRSPSLKELKQIASIFVFTSAVVIGYVYGLTKSTPELLREEN